MSIGTNIKYKLLYYSGKSSPISDNDFIVKYYNTDLEIEIVPTEWKNGTNKTATMFYMKYKGNNIGTRTKLTDAKDALYIYLFGEQNLLYDSSYSRPLLARISRASDMSTVLQDYYKILGLAKYIKTDADRSQYNKIFSKISIDKQRELEELRKKSL